MMLLVKLLLRGISEIFLPMLSSKTFTFLQLIFKSFIHLEFILVYGVRWWSSFIFLHVAVQISQNHLLKRLFVLHFIFLPPLSNINWPYWHGFISGLSILFHWSVSVLMPVPDGFDYSGLVIQFDIRYWSLLFCSSFSKLLRLLRVVYGSIYIFEMFVLYLWNMSLVF